MAVINGTPGKNFIHSVDDGLTAPARFQDIALATPQNDIIQAGAGDVDGDGDGASDFHIALNGTVNLTAADFAL